MTPFSSRSSHWLLLEPSATTGGLYLWPARNRPESGGQTSRPVAGKNFPGLEWPYRFFGRAGQTPLASSRPELWGSGGSPHSDRIRESRRRASPKYLLQTSPEPPFP